MNESLCHGIYQLYLFIPTKRRIVRIYTFFFFFFSICLLQTNNTIDRHRRTTHEHRVYTPLQRA